MFLKNYTSDVPVSETIARIEKVLVRCGVTGIMKEYASNGSGKITALTFQIAFEPGKHPCVIRVPVNEQAALQALWLDYADGDRISDDGNSITKSDGFRAMLPEKTGAD